MATIKTAEQLKIGDEVSLMSGVPGGNGISYEWLGNVEAIKHNRKTVLLTCSNYVSETLRIPRTRLFRVWGNLVSDSAKAALGMAHDTTVDQAAWTDLAESEIKDRK